MTNYSSAATSAIATEEISASIDPKKLARLDLIRIFATQWHSALIAVTIVTIGVILAWKDYVPFRARAIWCAISLSNYIFQGFASWKLASISPSNRVAQCWLPWFLASVAVGGAIWGAMPWMVSSASSSALLFACMFNLMLTFCVVNVPSTAQMTVCAVVPMSIVTVSALLYIPELRYESLFCATVFVFIGIYGLRVQKAIEASMTERHIAKDLAEKLEQNQQQLVQIEHDRTLLRERERLMRDMHDGIGSALSSALIVAEYTDMSRAEVKALLRECLDDLRVVIDSLDPIDNDLIALLATLRFRMEQRLNGAGLQLEWEMIDLPALTWMGPSESLQVLRLVQEALNNVIKHAGAKRVRLAVKHATDHIEILIADDGCGFDTSLSPPGRGLKTLQQRARALGGALKIDSQPRSGTHVLLALPIINAREQ